MSLNPRQLVPGLLLAATPALALPPVAISYHDYVLGTSCEVIAAESCLHAVDARVMADIEHLNLELNTRLPHAAINRGELTPDIRAVLAAYDYWRQRTYGAIDCRINGQLNIDALGKAYILDRAAAPHDDLLLNIGGDIRCTGPRTWAVDLANPFDPYDNAAPLLTLNLRNQAVATSGLYARGRHIVDARTGQPVAPRLAQATVVADDAVTANALATAAFILEPTALQDLIAETPNTTALLVTHDRRFVTFGQSVSKVAAETQKAASNWPADFAVTMAPKILPLERKPRERPYIAVWVETEKGTHVKTIMVYGNERKYLRELTKWYRHTRDNAELLRSCTRATRPAGEYSFIWRGDDQKNKPAETGRYVLCIETAFEHGGRQFKSVPLTCGEARATARMDRTPHFEAFDVVYDKRETKP